LRLTLITQVYTPDLSPTAHLCASLAEHRAAMGDQVTVVCGRGGYVKPVASGEDHGVRVIRVWTAQLGSRGLLSRLVDWLTFYVVAMIRTALLPRQDVIVCLTTPPYIVLAGVLQKMLRPRTRLVLWNMDCYPEAVERTGIIREGGIASRVMRALNRWIFRRIDQLVCLDAAMRDLLLSQYAPRNRELPVEVIPNWERASFFPKEWSRPTWDDPIAEILRGRFVVLYLGNAGYGHEFATMLDAADRLRDEPIAFLFVGGGAMRPWIAEQARVRGLSNIVLHDYVTKEQTPAVMGLSDCALITLENYAAGVMSPSKLHSNLAMGLPILYIGPRTSNVDEAIERFACGASVRPGDADAAAQFLRSLLRDRELHATFRSRAREAFEQAYCDERTLPRFDAMFDRLCATDALAQVKAEHKESAIAS
jgi:glycosyltransferase involved in cell wall biosynthesis